MNTALGLLALTGFVLSLVVHVFALRGIDVQSLVPNVWALHVGVFVVFFPMVFQGRSSRNNDDPMAIFRGFPAWAGVVIGLLMVYVVFNFFLSFSGSTDGSAAFRGGSFVLEYKGRFVREISETEYHARRAMQVRGFSGHWLIFYFIPFAHFLRRRRKTATTA